MSKLVEFCRKGDTEYWHLVERVYGTIKALEDGCTTQDIVDVIEPKVEISKVSSVVSWLTLSINAPVTSQRTTKGRHQNLRVVAPLPDVLYDNPDRQKRQHKNNVTPEMTIGDALQKMTRPEMLRLKIRLNELLAVNHG